MVSFAQWLKNLAPLRFKQGALQVHMKRITLAGTRHAKGENKMFTSFSPEKYLYKDVYTDTSTFCRVLYFLPNISGQTVMFVQLF